MRYIYLLIFICAISCTTTSDRGVYQSYTQYMRKKLVESELKIDHSNSSKTFCKDMDAIQFLTQNYLKDSKTTHSTKNTSKKLKLREMQALSHARQNFEPMLDDLGILSDLPLAHNEDVEKWIQYFLNSGRSTFLKWLVRAESVRETIQKELVNNGVPKGLFYLAMIESGLSSTAHSRARAVGTWQFMNGTGKLFDLKNDYWQDERKDPIKSTVAAASYLKHLYGIYGSWYLALASYNAGPGKINRAIKKSGSTDYWEISKTSYIRSETKNYVPKFLAAYMISIKPQDFGFFVARNPEWDLPEYTVQLKNSYHLKDLAAALGVEEHKLQQWNPQIKRSITPPAKPIYSFRLNKEAFDRFKEAELQLAAVDIKDYRLHFVKRGDTLTSIARRYQVDMGAIRALNPHLLSRKVLSIGQQIVVPF